MAKSIMTTKDETADFESAGFRWWCDTLTAFTEDDKNYLKISAYERILEMVKKGYSSGELNTTILKENEEEHYISGSWDITN